MQYPMNADREIPAIVSDALDYIWKTGLDVQGIFRLSGSRGRVSQIIQIYNSGMFLQALSSRLGSQVDFHSEELHDVTGVLKQYIRELPDPICCFSLYPEWLSSLSRLRPATLTRRC